MAREPLDDPVWFESVLLGFVRAYVEGSDEWPRLDQDRSSLCFLQGALCVDAMVRSHIETELVEVLRREGCGTWRDWAAVGEAIAACLARDASWVARLGEAVLPFYRLNVRYACKHPA